MPQHSGIRLLCFLIFTASLAAVPQLLWWFTPPLLALCWRDCTLHTAWRLLMRLRWLFVSLLLASLLFPLDGYTWAGLLHSAEFAAHRIAVLILLVFAAHWLVSTSSLADLVAGLDWLLHPLARLGTAALSLRLSLTLETVKQAQALYRDLPPLPTDTPRLHVWPLRLQQLFARVMDAAENAELVSLEIRQAGVPPWYEWLWPLGMVGFAMLLGSFNAGFEFANFARH